MTAFKRALCAALAVTFLTTSAAVPSFAEDTAAESSDRPYFGTERWIDTLKFPDRNTAVDAAVKDDDIAILYNGQAMEFVNKPYIKDSEIMLPIKEFVEKLGFFIGYQKELPIPGKPAGYFGRVNAADMSVEPGSGTAYYDDVPLELTTPTVDAGNDVYVPLYFVQYIYGLTLKIDGGTVNVSLERRVDESEVVREEIDIEEKVKDIQGENLITWEKMLENGNSGNPGDPVVSRVVDLEGEPFDKAIEIENNTKVEASYYNQKNFSSEIPVSIGDILVLTGWVRYTYCVDESGFATTHFCIESEGDWTKAIQTSDLQVGTKWQKFVYACSVPFNRDTKQVGFKIRVGYNFQHLQFADVNVVNYGKQVKLRDLMYVDESDPPLAYRGMEDDALWREEALRRIEKYRKSPIKVVVKDENGNPVKDAEVELNMTRNEFLFATEQDIHTWGERNRRFVYYEGLEKYFNGFVFGNNFKPGGDRQAAATMINFARDYNMYPRGHVLLYDSFGMTPKKAYTEEEIKQMDYDQYYEFYMKEVAGRISLFGDYIQEFELANELPDYRDARDKFGWVFVTDVLEGANELLGDGRIKMINSTGVSGQEGGVDYGGVSLNKKTFDSLREQGVEFNSVGAQGHSSDNQDPVNYYIQLDQLAQGAQYAGNTEYDFVSDLTRGSKEALHKEACHLRDYVLMFYSYPKATSFTVWGHADFYHWRRKGPLRDMTWVPKYEAEKYWMELVEDEWKPYITGKTDEDGEFNARTHRGEFDVTVTVGKKTAQTTLKSTKDGINTVTAVVGKDKVTLDTSEKVVTLAERTEPINLKEIMINDKNHDETYRVLAENKVKTAATEGGRDVGFLLDSENNMPCVLNGTGDALILELGEPRRKGYVTLDWLDGGKYVYNVEISEDGKTWEKIAGKESGDHDVIHFFYPENEPKNIKYIRISSADGKLIAPVRAGVYPVRYYAEKN